MSSPEKFGKPMLLKLWRNEFTRVFCDRLINKEDRAIVDQKIQAEVTSLVAESTTTSSDDFTSSLENPLIFGDFREMPKMLENYIRLFDGDEAEHRELRKSYEELI